MHYKSHPLIILLLVAGSSSSSNGQVPLAWRTGNEMPGIAGGVRCLLNWDPDGIGPLPELLVAGGASVQLAGGVIAEDIAAWDGKIWSPFGSGPGSTVYALAIFGNELFAGGISFGVRRWEGSSWVVTGAGLNGTVRAMTVFNGELIAGGQFTMSGQTQVSRIARWNGSVWQPLGTGMDNTVVALAVYQNQLFAGGGFASAGGVPCSRIARWNGSVWQPVGTGMVGGWVEAFAQHQGVLFAGGGFTSAGGSAADKVARWDGVSWGAMGIGPGHAATSLAVWKDLLIAGGDVPGPAISKWDGTKWSLLPGGVGSSMFETFISALGVYQDELITGGTFNIPGRGVARFDGTSWKRVGRGMNDVAYATSVFNGDLFMAGRFLSAGETDATRIVRYDGASFYPLGGGMNWDVYSLLPFRDELHASGYFTVADGNTVNGIARWDGKTWNSLEGGVSGGTANSPTSVLAMAEYNGDLIAGGNFSNAGSTPANNIARWDGSKWHPLASGMSGAAIPPPIVIALKVWNGNLYAGGYFTSAGGVPANYIARWDGTTWSAVGGGGMDGGVFALGVYNNQLLVGGEFGSAVNPQVIAEGLARWNGSTWTGFGTQCCTQVYAFSDYEGQLIVGGRLSIITAGFYTAIARWSGSGSLVGLGMDQGGTVRGLSKFRNELIAVGEFGQIGNIVSAYWARRGPNFSKGDMNCDQIVNTNDIPPFVTLLLQPTTFGDANAWLADVSSDGNVDGHDIPPFIATLKP